MVTIMKELPGNVSWLLCELQAGHLAASQHPPLSHYPAPWASGAVGGTPYARTSTGLRSWPPWGSTQRHPVSLA